jgi:hypothetical protein
LSNTPGKKALVSILVKFIQPALTSAAKPLAKAGPHALLHCQRCSQYSPALMDASSPELCAQYMNALLYEDKAALQTGVNIMVQRQKIEVIPSITRGQNIMQETAMLRVNGLQMKITLNSIVIGAERQHEEHTPLPPGLYRVRLPDHPHDKSATDGYRSREEPNLKNHQVWFPIEYGNNSRYIHVGHLSHGCVTVMQLAQWNALYQALIEHRMSGTEYVGQILISKSIQP